LRHAGEQGEIPVEAVLDADVIGLVVLTLVEPGKQNEPPGAPASNLSRALKRKPWMRPPTPTSVLPKIVNVCIQ
jgi:hypothetical protein